MSGTVRRPFGLALLMPLVLLREAPPPAPAIPPARPVPEAGARDHLIPDRLVPIPITGGSPEPPAVLPPARSCRDGTPEYDSADRLAGQVNGELVQGVEGLLRLRRAWGDSLIVLRNGNFAGADLRGVRLHNICFVGTNFAESDWSGATARGIGFIYADLSRAKLRRARMPQIKIRDPHLEGADATGADFTDGHLSGNAQGSWEGLRFDRADLRRFSFDCGRTQEGQCVANQSGRAISFRGADLRDAKVDTYWGQTDWRGARLGRTQVSLRQLSRLTAAIIEGPLVVREDKAKAALSPREYRWLSRRMSGRDSVERPRKGTRPAWMKPGVELLFTAPPIELDEAVRSAPIYRRLLPVLVEGASSVLLVQVRRSGRIDISGRAAGGNGHMCSVGGRNLRYDRSSGWFVGEDQGEESFGGPPPERPMPIVAFSSDRADIYENGRPWGEKNWGFDHFGSCGARAGFDRMTRLPLSAAQARRLYRAWD